MQERVIGGYDYGVFVLARACRGVDTALRVVQGHIPAGAECVQDAYAPLMMHALTQVTRFGRIGVFLDRRDTAARDFFTSQEKTKGAYTPREARRAEKSPHIRIIESTIVQAMASEGLDDTVEFRRLMRKYLRHAKHAHCDTILFPAAIFAHPPTQKIIRHLAGSQIRCVFVTDVLPQLQNALPTKNLGTVDISSPVAKISGSEMKNAVDFEGDALPIIEKAPAFFSQRPEFAVGNWLCQQCLTIETTDDIAFCHKRAETLLGQKISQSCIRTPG